MNEYHVTYIRDGDRTRVVFVLEAETQLEAEFEVALRAPWGFRLAASRRHDGGAIEIGMDGDRYGGDEQRPTTWMTAADPQR